MLKSTDVKSAIPENTIPDTIKITQNSLLLMSQLIESHSIDANSNILEWVEKMIQTEAQISCKRVECNELKL